MSYLVNQTRLASVSINGQNLTDRVIDITLSDSSGIKNGLIATDGTIQLGRRPGSPDRSDYSRSVFARGAPVVIDIKFPSGNTTRHPRGRLYVIDTTFDPTDESITVSVGCRMALAALDGNLNDIKHLPKLFITPTRMSYASISAALAAEGKIVWYDSYGSLRSTSMFGGEGYGYSPFPNWVSVFGVTTLAISALDSTRSIKTAGNPYSGGDPDDIELSYEYTECKIDPNTNLPKCDDDDNANKIDIAESQSRYYLQYPAIYYEREKDPDEDEDEEESDGLNDAGEPESDQGLQDARPSNCVVEPIEDMNPASESDSGGDGEGDTDCMEGYKTIRKPLYVGVRSSSRSETHYDGPGGQRDRTFTETYGPALDANNQFYGDLYQICRQSWATACSPNGYCPTSAGTAFVKLTETEQIVEFNQDGSIDKEITDNYATYLSAAVASNWRANVVDGKIQGFKDIRGLLNTMYRQSRVEVKYKYPEVGTLRETTTYTSITSRGNGLPGSVSAADALNGIVTSRIDRSFSLNVNAELPPTKKKPEPPTESDISIIRFPRYDSFGVSLTNKLTFKEAMPYPILLTTGSPLSVTSVLRNYERYIRMAIKGQSLGLRIGEALREEISTRWSPNVSFRYSDPRHNTLISLRGDAHTWSITPEKCVFSCDGLFVGFSNGTVSVPDNIKGATTAIL